MKTDHLRHAAVFCDVVNELRAAHLLGNWRLKMDWGIVRLCCRTDDYCLLNLINSLIATTRRLLRKHVSQSQKIIQIASLVAQMRTRPVNIGALSTLPVFTGRVGKKSLHNDHFLSTLPMIAGIVYRALVSFADVIALQNFKLSNLVQWRYLRRNCPTLSTEYTHWTHVNVEVEVPALKQAEDRRWPSLPTPWPPLPLYSSALCGKDGRWRCIVPRWSRERAWVRCTGRPCRRRRVPHRILGRRSSAMTKRSSAPIRAMYSCYSVSLISRRA